VNVEPKPMQAGSLAAQGDAVAPSTRPGAGAVKSGSICRVPVNQPAGPFAEGCKAARVMFTSLSLKSAHHERLRHGLVIPLARHA
jgi:hypothetical protein